MKLGIVISTNDAEAAWNAFRLANCSRKENDSVRVFLVGKAVEYDEKSTDRFPAKAEAEKFFKAGGEILACGICMKQRNKEGTGLCPLSTMNDLYALIKESEKVVCF